MLYGGSRAAARPALPVLAPGTELLGRFRGSAYRDAPSLVRRADGQVLQVSPLVYLVASAVDGTRDAAEIAAVVSEQHERPLDADGVRYLLETKLVPAGVVSLGAGTAAEPPPRAKPLLALRGRVPLLRPRATNLVGVLLRPMFRPPVVVAVLLGVGAVDYWLFFQHGLQRSVSQVLRDPALLLGLLALTWTSALFHETGHAAACRYGGARPGAIGFGLYLVWPAFYTDVTDSYRLGRGGRLRVDLGGVYFNAVFMLGLLAAYAATGQEILLLAVVVSHFEVLEQLMPFVRFDGYFVLSDVLGVPDLFARIGPILRSVTRSGRRDPRVRGLRPAARVLVTGWVALVVPVLAVNVGYLALHLPRIETSLAHSSWAAATRAATDLGQDRYAGAALGGIGAVLVVLPALGAVYILVGTLHRAVAAYRRLPGKRWLPDHALALVVTASLLAGIGAVWLAQAHELPRPPAGQAASTR